MHRAERRYTPAQEGAREVLVPAAGGLDWFTASPAIPRVRPFYIRRAYSEPALYADERSGRTSRMQKACQRRVQKQRMAESTEDIAESAET